MSIQATSSTGSALNGSYDDPAESNKPFLNDFNMYIPDYLYRTYFDSIQKINILLATMRPYVTYTELVLTFAGVLANVAILTTFLRIGLADIVTIVLFNIAVSDITHLIIRILYFYFMYRFVGFKISKTYSKIEYLRSNLDTAICNILERLNVTMVLANALLTTFLAVQRCLCVVRPLQFKRLLTRRRTKIVVWSIWGYCFLCNIPRFTQYRFKIYHVPIYNRTDWKTVLGYEKVIHFTWTRLYIQVYDPFTELINSSILLFACQAIVIGSIFIMLYSLKKHAKFRQKTTQSRVARKANNTQVDSELDNSQSQGNNMKTGKDTRDSSYRERQVMVQVLLVSLIFILAHLHKTLYEICARIFGSELTFSFGSKIYDQFYDYFYILNSSINIIIYLKYNSKFRNHFMLRIGKR